MSRRSLLPLGIVLLSFRIAGAADAAAPYYFTTLAPAATVGTDAYPNALNTVGGHIEIGGNTKGGYVTERGIAATWSNVSAGGTVLGTPNPTLSQVSAGGATETGKVWGIDGNGDLAGYSEYAVSGLYNHFYPWFLPAGGGAATLLPMLNGGDTEAFPFAMNNSQQIVGTENDGGRGVVYNTVGQAALWTQTAGTWGVAALPSLSGGGASGANAIVNDGRIIGGWANNAAGQEDGATWTNNGSGWVANDLVNRSLPQYAVGASVVFAVNSSGVAVGMSNMQAEPIPDYPTYAVTFSGGYANSLGTLGAAIPNDTALGINDSGVVVGSAETTAGGLDAFIYGLGGNKTMQDMNTVFAGSIPAGWSLTAATAVDNNGDIVGYGNNGSPGAGFLLSPAIPGDANLDGRVDINDLTIVLSHYGQTGMAWAQGEFVGDGSVDINDLTIVLAHYNLSFGASSAANVSAVPEPCALVLIGIGATALLACAWRKRK